MINKWNLKAVEFASREESRYTMQVILVRPEATIATDGHMLAWVSTAPIRSENFPEVPHAPRAQDDFAPFLLATDAAQTIAKALPKKTNIPALMCAGVAVKDGQAIVTVTDLETPQTFRPAKVTGQFPQWERFMKEGDTPKATFTLNPALLARVAKFAAEFGGDRASVKVSYYGDGEAIRFDVTREETEQGATILLMPMRDSGDVRHSYGWDAREAKREAEREAEKAARAASELAEANEAAEVEANAENAVAIADDAAEVGDAS